MKIKVKVKPNSNRELLEKISEGEYKADIKDPPEKGKANLKLIKLIGKEFKVSQDKIGIKNPHSRIKIVEIKS